MQELIDKYKNLEDYLAGNYDETIKHIKEKRLIKLQKLKKDNPEKKKIYQKLEQDIKSLDYYLIKQGSIELNNDNIKEYIRSLPIENVSKDHIELLEYLENNNMNEYNKKLRIYFKNKEKEDIIRNETILDKIQNNNNFTEIEKLYLTNMINAKKYIQTNFNFFDYYNTKVITSKIFDNKSWLSLTFSKYLSLNILMIEYDNELEYNDKITILNNCEELQNFLNICKINNIEIKYIKEISCKIQ